MLYDVISFFYTTASYVINLIWFLSNFAVILLHYFSILVLFFCMFSRFLKVAQPKNVKKILRHADSKEEDLFYPIAFFGAYFDVPEMSSASLAYSTKNHCNKILYGLEITECGELILIHKSTLEKANITKSIDKTKFDDLKSFNLSDHHALGKQFENQKILTLKDLLKAIKKLDVTIFLLTTNLNQAFIEKLKQAIHSEPEFVSKIVFCCDSSIRHSILLYKLRKAIPTLACGCWMDKANFTKNKKFLKLLTIFTSFYEAIYRNMISSLLGISLVFIHKDEFNAQIADLWKDVSVTPVVYFVNSPSEKRYFQKGVKIQYLTNSLRSEPQVIFNNSNNTNTPK